MPGMMRRPPQFGVNDGAPWKTFLRLVKGVAKAYPAHLLFVAACIVLSSLAGVAGSLFLRTLIDGYIAPLAKSPSPDFSGLVHAISIMAAVYLGGVAATFLFNRVMVSVSQGAQKEIRDLMFARMQRLPIRYFDAHAHGDVMSRYTNDIDTLRQMLSQSLPNVASSLFTAVMVFVAMVAVSPPLTALVLVVSTLSILASRYIGGRSAGYFVRQQESLGKLNGYIEEMMTGQRAVKLFNREGEEIAAFDALNDDLAASATSANKYANILMPVMVNMGNIQFVLIAVLGGVLAVGGDGALTLGAIASFLQLSRSFSQPVNQVSQQLNSVVMALAGAERIYALMDEEPEGDAGYVTLVDAKEENGAVVEARERTGHWAWRHPHGTGEVTYTRLAGDVEFENVDFAYVPGKQVLFDIALRAAPGEKVAFVGATGAGKTTITNLINRFYDLQDGKIRYDGINIEKIKKPDLRRSLGVVLQETNLFTGTVRDNIRYGRLDAADAEVEAAARLANADKFIELLPEKYETRITGDGDGLSQGQRQLLAVARAAVADPPVMILDEATSSIDTRTENIVRRGMNSLMRGRTVFAIAHRLSTIRDSDVIMVMDGGRIVERGTHAELLAKRGLYYQLNTGALELS